MVEGGKISGQQGMREQVEQASDETAVDAANLAQHALEIHLGEPEGKGVGGGGFKVMRFIHDEVLVFGQHAVAGDHIRQQEGVVDDQDVRGLGCHAHLVEGAGAAGAADAHLGFAAFIFGGEARPDFAFAGTVEVDLAAVTAAALIEPDQHLGQHAQFIRVVGAGLAQGFEAARAEVIAASFDDHGAHLGFEGVGEVGDILLDQLVLQGDGVGGDDHAHGVLERPLHGGDEVGKGFARAGAGFHHQVLAFGEGMADRAQHFDLLRAALEVVKVMGEGSAVFNLGSHLVSVQWRGGFHGDERRQGDAGAEEVTVIILAGFFGFDGHAPFFAQGCLEHGSAVPIKTFRVAHDLGENLNGELEELLVKGVQHGMGQAGSHPGRGGCWG